jgi:N-acetylmuramoyl-L-alanine amidase
MSKIIALDDGHGQNPATPGKRTPDGYLENYFNHKVKIELIKILKRCGFKVIDCSPELSDTSLSTRIKRANNGKADIFVSIHFNAYGSSWNSVDGIEVYYYENGSYYSKNGKKLATYLYDEIIKGTVQDKRGVKGAKFDVIRYTTMPAVLAEYGFMTNKHEAELMQDVTFVKECAIETANGICKYFGISYKAETIKDYKTILKEVSNYSDIWISFVKAHQEVNLDGLIEVLYYHKCN